MMDLRSGDCLAFLLPTGLFGAAVILARRSVHGIDWVLVAITRLAMDHPPGPHELVGADVLIMNYDGLLYPSREIYLLRASSFSAHASRFTTTGRISVSREFDLEAFVQAGDGWDGIADTVYRQLEWERECAGPTERLPLANLLSES
jgi:hypothetical protein